MSPVSIEMSDDKWGGKRGIYALEDEGQASDADNIYQTAAANVKGEASGSEEVKNHPSTSGADIKSDRCSSFLSIPLEMQDL